MSVIGEATGPSAALTGVSQGFGRRRVLHDVSLEFFPGITALVGPNGAGKTTLMRTLTTQLRPRNGSLCIAGKEIDNSASARAARRNIGYLPQDFGAESRFTVQDYVTYLGWLREIPGTRLGAAVSEAIEAVDLGSETRTRMGRLSGGMRQRAGIAGAIVGGPELVVLDEPTVGLDPAQRLSFRDLLRRLLGHAVILSTHLIEDVSAIAERVVVINAGAVLFDGKPAELAAFGAVRNDMSPLEAGYLSLLDSREGRTKLQGTL